MLHMPLQHRCFLIEYRLLCVCSVCLCVLLWPSIWNDSIEYYDLMTHTKGLKWEMVMRQLNNRWVINEMQWCKAHYI